MADTWEPAAQVAKNDAGKFVALIGGKWEPVASASKNDAGQFMVLRGQTRPKAPIETPAFEKEAAVIAEGGLPEFIASDPTVRLARGVASPALGLAQLGLNAVGAGNGINTRLRDFDAMVERGNMTRGSGAIARAVGGGAELAGEIGSTLALPAMRAAPAASALGRAGQGAALGATQAVLAPVTGEGDYLPQKLAQVATGAALGGVLSPVVDLVKGGAKLARNVVQPHLGQWGLDRSTGRMVNDVAGDSKNAIIRELGQNKSAVPGVNYTAAQAAVPAGSPEFAALQKIAEARAPGLYSDVAGIGGQQEAARQAAVNRISKGVVEQEAAKTARSTEAAQKYGNAYLQQVRADPQLAQLASNPYFKDAIPTALKLAEANGVSPKSDLTKFLHYVKISLDKQLERQGETALAKTEKETVIGLKNSLMSWLGAKNPAYDNARTSFEAASKPINEMRVGEKLKSALTSSAGGQERDTVFGNAVDAARTTISKGSNSPLIDAVTPKNRAVIDAVMGDLKNNRQVDTMAREGVEKARETIGLAVPKIPTLGMFSPALSVTRAMVNRLEGKATTKLLDHAAKIMANPAETARIMKLATPAEQKVLNAMIQASQRAAVTGAVEQF